MRCLGADLRAVWALKRAGSHTAADDGQRWLGAAMTPRAHSMEQVDKSRGNQILHRPMRTNPADRGHSRLSDLDKVAIRIAHVASQFRCMDFRLCDEVRAPRR